MRARSLLGPHHRREQAHDEHRARRPERVTANDRAASRVEDASSTPSSAAKAIACAAEDSAHLDRADVLGVEARQPAVELAHRLDRRACLVAGCDALGRARDEPQRTRLAELLPNLLRDHYDHGRPVADGARVAGGQVPSGGRKGGSRARSWASGSPAPWSRASSALARRARSRRRGGGPRAPLRP